MSRPNPYGIVRNKHQEEFNRFTKDKAFFAFSDEQFLEGIKGMGMTLEEAKKNLASLGYGMFVPKKYLKEYRSMDNRHFNQSKMFMSNPDYAYAAFLYELVNHEYGYTYDPEDAVMSLGYSLDEVERNPVLREALHRAMRRIEDEDNIPNEIWAYISKDSTVEDIISQINAWDGSLDDLEVSEDFDDFIRTYYPDPVNAVRAAAYGHLNFSDDYIGLDGNGNIRTIDEVERERELEANRNRIMKHVLNDDRLELPEEVHRIRNRYDNDFAPMDRKRKLRLPKLSLKGKASKPLIDLKRRGKR